MADLHHLGRAEGRRKAAEHECTGVHLVLAPVRRSSASRASSAPRRGLVITRPRRQDQVGRHRLTGPED